MTWHMWADERTRPNSHYNWSSNVWQTYICEWTLIVIQIYLTRTYTSWASPYHICNRLKLANMRNPVQSGSEQKLHHFENDWTVLKHFMITQLFPFDFVCIVKLPFFPPAEIARNNDMTALLVKQIMCHKQGAVMGDSRCQREKYSRYESMPQLKKRAAFNNWSKKKHG